MSPLLHPRHESRLSLYPNGISLVSRPRTTIYPRLLL
jgi:hypothetical protein